MIRMRDCSDINQTIRELRDENVIYHFSRDYLRNVMEDAADAIEELLAKVPTAERLAEILSRYFQIGDSYTFELTRVKEAFAIGTMSFDDFSEWDDENVSDLAEYIMESLSAPPKEDA